MRVAKNAESGTIIPFASKNQVVACWAVLKSISKSFIKVGRAVPNEVCINAPENVANNIMLIIILGLYWLPWISKFIALLFWVDIKQASYRFLKLILWKYNTYFINRTEQNHILCTICDTLFYFVLYSFIGVIIWGIKGKRS